MKRINLFAKGNVDVHDSLHSCRIDGKVMWNGINEYLRVSHPHVTLRIRHETLNRFDALLAATDRVPDALAGHDLALGNYPLRSQFSHGIYNAPADAAVLSILPDVASKLVRHKTDQFLFYPANAAGWPLAEREWLRTDFEAVSLMSVEQSMENLATVVECIRAARDVPVLVYNMSPVIPGDFTHCYLGLDETYATRIRRYNLALIELSRAIGISIVDVDAILARNGAERLKLDVMHLHPQGYRLVAAEVVRILDDLGIFEDEGA